ncbi:MAG: helix-turn-helix domain-containing protein [Lentisphaeria bacterium]|nr:helix-turn-helix domain-containing protein [Lentisphaeria bacterium]
MANNDLVGSLTKGMDILKLVGNSEHRLKAGEIAAALNLKTSTCYNLVRTLCAGDFLERRGGNFCIGSAIVQLAGNSHYNRFVAAAEHELLHLYQAINWGTAIYAKFENGQMLQTHRVSFERPGVIQRHNDESMHPYASASGLLGLAFTDDESTRLIIASRWPFSEFGAHLWRDRHTLAGFLKNIRQERVAESPFDKEDFIRISGAVVSSSGKLSGTIGVSVPTARVRDHATIDRFKKLVSEAASRLSERLD